MWRFQRPAADRGGGAEGREGGSDAGRGHELRGLSGSDIQCISGGPGQGSARLVAD